MVTIIELSDSSQNLSQDKNTTSAKKESSNLNIIQDPSKDGVGKETKGTIDTGEALKKLNDCPDLNKHNVVRMMRRFIIRSWDHSNLHYRYLASTAGEHYVFPEGCTFLHIAARFDCHTLARFLIERGMNVNAPDKSGAKPLYYALKYNNLKTAKFLIGKGADYSCISMISHDKADKVFATIFKPTVIIGVFVTLGLVGSVLPLNDISLIEKILVSCFAILAATAGATLIGGVAYGVKYVCSKHELSSKLDEVSYKATSPAERAV